MTAKFRTFLLGAFLSGEASNVMSDMFLMWKEKLHDSSPKKIACCKNENHRLPIIMEEAKMFRRNISIVKYHLEKPN